MEFFERQKVSVKNFIDVFLHEKRREFVGVNLWGEDVLEKITPFVKSGKMLRSGLVCLGYEMCKRKISPVIFPAAAAVEFIQTALLIHDDIIDRDKYRRGIPSLFYQYAQRGEEEGVADPFHFGQGMAICLGDIGFFLAFELFSELKVAKAIKETIIRLWSQELSYVGLAQMQDLYFGETRTEIEAEDILQLYHYKTARYSFSLPLKIGGILGGAHPTLLKGLERCGHALGLLFQLKDDELGLYGSEKELGKPVGSDLKECKKTLHYYYLCQRAGVRDVKRFEKICGNSDLSMSMVQEVRTMMKKYGVDKAITDRMNALQKEVEAEIAGLDIQEKYRNILHELSEFSAKRKK
ncbi:MAG: polyprenyl synthetase family protein [Candidatus Aminicenantes bacterium]|nr:MAG: polyprenyl synthetase family protein [Candidatus Aminicenantes bacterium]